MQLHVVAVAVATACFVTGCGFIPKSPPTPSGAQRVPINLAAPYIGPWPAPTTTAVAVPVSVPPVTPAPVVSEQATAAATPANPTHETLPLEQAELTRTPATFAATWPITVSFNPSDELLAPEKRLVPRQVTFAWPSKPEPEPVAPTPLQETTAGPLLIPGTESMTAVAVTGAEKFEITSQTSLAQPDQFIAASTTSEHADPAALPSEVPEKTTGSPQPSNDESAPDTAQSPQPEPVSEPTPTIQSLTWSAKQGMALSDLLREWAALENWSVRWNSPVDFLIEADFSIQATDFLAAANHIFNAYRKAGRVFLPVAYANNVLVVDQPRE